nr:Fe-S cluster assembly protein SufD [Cryptomonas curvata]
MFVIPTVKIVSFFSKGEKLPFYRKLNSNFQIKITNNTKGKKNSHKFMMYEKYIDGSSNWIKKLTTSRINTKNKLIKDLNRAGNINENEVWIFFTNGIYSPELSSIDKLPKNFYFGSFSELPINKQKNILDIANKGESGINGGFFSALNAACLEDIAILLIPENSNFEKNINLVFQGQGTGNNFYINQKFVIINSKNSFSKIVQYHLGEDKSIYFDNTTASIVLNENSSMEYNFINQVPETASQITSIHVEIEKNAHFQFSSASTGGFLSRLNIGIDINGINSSTKLNGISLANKRKTIDIHSRISHNYPECTSSQLHKNLVSEEGHAIFAGKIQVHSGSFNTKSEQLCKTLLLSSTSRIDTMPILEINNDNVKCTHGATVSDLDKNQLFYLQSRGISSETAKKILTNGFFKDIIDCFPSGFIKDFFSNLYFF